MKQQWTDRGIKGAKYLAVGALLTLSKDPALHVAQSSNFALVAVNLVFGVLGPILIIPGLYLIGTRHKKSN